MQQAWICQPSRFASLLMMALVVMLVIGLGWMQLDNLWNSPFQNPLSGFKAVAGNLSQSVVDGWVGSQQALLDQLQQQSKNATDHLQALLAELQQQSRSATNHLLERQQQLENTLATLQHELESQRNVTSGLEQKIQWLDEASQLFWQHLRSPQLHPLKDVTQANAKSATYAFMSAIEEASDKQSASPELFYFPSSISQGRLLCVKGSNPSDGTKNLYGYAYAQALPAEALLLPGTTLLSDNHWDFVNPWHSMYSLVQFLHWRMNHSCGRADHLVLYHWGELRASMGYWISSVLEALGLPFVAEALSYGGRPVCFESAVVSRAGIGAVSVETLGEVFAEMRCASRRWCNLTAREENPASAGDEFQVTLMARSGARSFHNLSAWENVVKRECEKSAGCRWVSMHVANLTFCQQVEIMSATDVLVSVHGAQLTNMIFMNRGGRILEMFPKGWLELAGHGQFIYRNLADWVGLQHEGYWRDPDTPDCPDATDAKACFSFYKNQSIGINITHHSNWLREVIADFNKVKTDQQYSFNKSSLSSTCKC